jgi:hypothetical protein
MWRRGMNPNLTLFLASKITSMIFISIISEKSLFWQNFLRLKGGQRKNLKKLVRLNCRFRGFYKAIIRFRPKKSGALLATLERFFTGQE